MNAKNHAGYQVESYCRHTGWRRATRVFPDYVEACKAYDTWPVQGVELRVSEALHPAPLTPMQWLGEAVKRVRRFYRVAT